MSTPRRIRSLARTIAVGLVVAALVQELAKPSDQRTWTGHVLGFVPYDFRRPTWRRVREAYWNPDDPRLFTERVLGVGWAINLHRAGVLLSSLFSRLGAETERTISLRHWDGG